MRIRSIMFSLAFVASTVAWGDTVDVFGADDYAGISYLQEGKPQGVFPQILSGVSRISGDTYNLRLLPWKRAQAKAAAAEGGIAHFSKTADRETQFDFSNPVYGDRIELVVLKGREFEYKSLTDLVGKRVGAKQGASFGQKVDQFLASPSVTLERDPGVTNRLKKLLANRIDVAIVEGADGHIGRAIAGDRDLEDRKSEFAFLSTPLVEDSLFLAFAKSMGRKETLNRFNKALEKFKATAEYKQLISHN